MEDHIRICMISYMFSPYVAGAELFAERQARQLQAFGHDVTVVTLRCDRGWKPAETLDGLPVVRVGGIYGREGRLRSGRLGHFPIDIAMFLTLWRLRHSYDVIHAYQVSTPGAVATLIGKITGKPVIMNIQCAGPSRAERIKLEQGATLMSDTLVGKFFPRIDPKNLVTDDINYLQATVLGGRTILNFLRKSKAFYQILSTRSHSYLISHGFRAEQIVHIPVSVDAQKFSPTPEGRPDTTRPERDIICVARLDYSKGVDVLLHSWGRMMRAPAEWRVSLKPRLLLVGDGAFRSQLEEIAAELGISESVEFLRLRTDIVELLQHSWGFALCSRYEGMPSALLEAMACGLPCVATRVSGSEDIITNGIDGLLVEPEQPAEFAQALRRIIEDTNLSQRLGQEARATVVRDYQLPMVVEQCLQLYRRLLSAGKNRNDDTGQPEGMPLQVGGSLQGGVLGE